jgi:hypothetical protein
MTDRHGSTGTTSSDSPDPEKDEDDLLPEYDFDYSKGRPNRFAAPLPSGGRIVTLDPDVTEVFPNAEAVNAVLRALIITMPRQAR